MTRRQEELTRLRNGPTPNTPMEMVPAWAWAICDGDAEMVLQRATEVLDIVLARAIADWPADDLWPALLPEWFVRRFEDRPALPKTPPGAHAGWLKVEPHVDEPGTLVHWLREFQADSWRDWYWWDAVSTPTDVQILLETEDHQYYRHGLFWLLYAAGAGQVFEEPSPRGRNRLPNAKQFELPPGGLFAMNRVQRSVLAEETLNILYHGNYTRHSRRLVDISAPLEAAVATTRLYRPADFPPVPRPVSRLFKTTQISVTDETTIGAARRLVGDGRDVLCMNFASARNPGGGFRSGALAQEESLAVSSGLYWCISQMEEMYEYNKRHRSGLYSDHMIYSPRVPVFRGEDAEILDVPYQVSFITAPAVNAGAVRRNQPHNVGLIEPTMRSRLAKVLWVAAQHGHTTLVLGAWGCGVFGNDPAMVARLIADALTDGGDFAGAFESVVCAVHDRAKGQPVLSAFREVFPA